MQFLYMGFSQRANIRSYRFQGVVPRQRPSKMAKNVEFLLSADMSLLAQHHIRVQDGPTLCLRILAALSGAEADMIQFSSYTITLADVSAFTTARAALEQSKSARRRPRPPFKPAPASQLKWPQVK
ncbi:MAG TPA: hypothetical protein VEV17_07870 [Bryobacteraceae bacterium]|nr:hypothetical protein [Bryobacteraceae bacterium]